MRPLAGVRHGFYRPVEEPSVVAQIGERRPDPRGLMEMAFNLCRRTQIGYFAFTRDLTVCLRQFHEHHPTHRLEGIQPVDARAEV